MAFQTLRYNLIDGEPSHFDSWPSWFPKEPCSIQRFTENYAEKLIALQDQVTLVAGGPPCQGFSYAGKRQKHDYRNQLYRSYLEVVRLVRPSLVLLENVSGIRLHFGGKPRWRRKPGRPQIPYSERIKQGLVSLGYQVFETEVTASDFGVPQSRVRYVAVGIDLAKFQGHGDSNPFGFLAEIRAQMLAEKGLGADRPISCKEAIGDLEYNSSLITESPDTKGFFNGLYQDASSSYQTLMRGSMRTGTPADSHRFVNHTHEVSKRFGRILRDCPKGKQISDQYRLKHGIKKSCTTPLHPERPATTLTTLPDDIIHYSQPRVLTARESARLQSFPDWFEFKSKYTTGGPERKTECPRYTQIGNAVPPLLGEALGRALIRWLESVACDSIPRPLCDRGLRTQTFVA
jgi:DNA (cytosine-5)-methyltransferase 1